MGQRSDIWTELRHLPLFLLLFGLSALSMLVPAFHGLIVDDHEAGRAFFYAGLLGLILFAMFAVVLSSRPRNHTAMGPLLSLFSSFVLLPLFFALPFIEALPTTRFINAYFEMVSALTTTGASLFEPERLHPSLHLWRGLVGSGQNAAARCRAGVLPVGFAGAVQRHRASPACRRCRHT